MFKKYIFFLSILLICSQLSLPIVGFDEAMAGLWQLSPKDNESLDFECIKPFDNTGSSNSGQMDLAIGMLKAPSLEKTEKTA